MIEEIASAETEKATTEHPRGEVPAGMRVYAFGDVHGRADLLARFFGDLDREAEEAGVETTVIGLGDYIDRGPHSREVIDLLARQAASERRKTVILRGNHEALLLDFISQPEAIGPSWLRMGGWETLVSYGVRCTPNARGEELLRVRAELLDRLPTDHLTLLNSLPFSATIGAYFFVHAGARPGIPLSRQRADDLLWIRSGFSDRDVPFDKVIVHGHTPVTRPFVGRHRVNLDTGAYATGRLTCAKLEAKHLHLIEIRAETGSPA